MNRSFDTFIFDLDGTLLDTLADLVALTNRVLREAGFSQRSERQIQSYIGDGLWALLQRAAPKASASELDQMLDNWMHLYPKVGMLQTKEYAGISSMLEKLKRRNKNLAVLSNKFDDGVASLIPTLFPHVFSVYQGVCDRVERKPNPQGLQNLIAGFGTPLDKVAYIGDSPVDIITARAAGVEPIGVSWGYHTKAQLLAQHPFAIIESPHELLHFA